ncbi:hypothetical protein SAMN05421878_102185 [Actinobaculum suis]|uniref:Uncharacterized protein n=1 Tax=Actinobaculum suis TaxID=1657 RepID=A0A1G7AED9_9ACTO|nr:hypothetical protein [Actinobaculum suis]MDY5152590.1 hypothetical protein [Actinobaculum suis]SDE13053.1 hypothetical protein SAMN05421878_102185 [Actinobaculum suis]
MTRSKKHARRPVLWSIRVFCDSDLHDREGKKPRRYILGTFEPEPRADYARHLLEAPEVKVRGSIKPLAAWIIDGERYEVVSLWRSVPHASNRTYKDNRHLGPVRKVARPDIDNIMPVLEGLEKVDPLSPEFGEVLETLRKNGNFLDELEDACEIVAARHPVPGEEVREFSEDHLRRVHAEVCEVVSSFLGAELKSRNAVYRGDLIGRGRSPDWGGSIDWGASIVRGAKESFEGGALYWEFKCRLCSLEAKLPARQLIPAFDELMQRKISWVSFVDLLKTRLSQEER